MSFTYLRYHVVFATKGRARFLYGDTLPRTVQYIGGIARNHGGILHLGGGMPDHVHLLITVPPTRTVSDFIGSLKSFSSGWIHRTFPDLKLFGWQDGYAAFTVSPSIEPQLSRYIERQAHHPLKLDSRLEMIRLLEKHGIPYDEKYLE
ncbi:MAG: IS200/IS605 family transposase [Acidobacteria bacterium]|nr:IS200/IS605 family transposase [Acidobacteriota bacterium]